MADTKKLTKLLQEQIAYYRARAPEYDDSYLRRGRYDRGPELNRQRFAELEEVAKALDSFAPRGQVLELACGTGWWTKQLACYAENVTAVDASPEMIVINRGRVGGFESKVRYVESDIFSWRPDACYDVVFFGFWLSHVPSELFTSFWELVRSCLTPNGRVFFVDSKYNETSTAIDHRLEGSESVIVKRRLNDGQEFRVIKVFYQPEELTLRLSELGWRVVVQTTANFLYGFGSIT